MKSLILVLVAAALSGISPTLARAEGGTGTHGGTGIWMNNRLCLMDLVDNTGCKGAIIDTHLKPRPEYFAAVSSALKSVFPAADSPQILMISQKLTEIGNVSPSVAEYLVAGMGLYSWSMPPSEFKYIGDDHSPLKLREGDKVTIAVRQDRSIKFSGILVPLLPIEQQVALFFHEMGYSFTSPVFESGGPYHLFQDSIHAKDFTGFIFGRILEPTDAVTLASVVHWLGMPDWKLTKYRSVTEDSIATLQANPFVQIDTRDSLDYPGYPVDWQAQFDPSRGFFCAGKDCQASDIATWCSLAGRVRGGGVWFGARQIQVAFASYPSWIQDPTAGQKDVQQLEYLRVKDVYVYGSKAGGIPGAQFQADTDNCAATINDVIANATNAFAKYVQY